MKIKQCGILLNFELGKGNFNSEINLFIIPINGFGLGFLSTFNYFWHSRIGGAYLGGGVGYSWITDRYYDGDYYDTHSLIVGINAGYKFVLRRSGIYFRTGGFVGFNLALSTNEPNGVFPLYFKPDLAIGWTIR